MRSRIKYLLIILAVAGIATAVGIARGRTQQPPVTHYAYVLKVKNPDFATKGPKPEEMPAVQAHIKYIQNLLDKGVCVVAGHTLNHEETSFGLAILKTDSAAAAKEIMEQDPLVKTGILQGAVYPFDVTFAPSVASR